MTKETTKARPTHRVHAVTENGEKKFWQPIGAMWAPESAPRLGTAQKHSRQDTSNSSLRIDTRDEVMTSTPSIRTMTRRGWIDAAERPACE
jgi:hypothetical protein